MSFGAVRRAPYLVQQLLLPHQLSTIAHQHSQHRPFGGCQVYLSAVADHLVRGKIHVEGLGMDHRLGTVRGARRTAARSRAKNSSMPKGLVT